MSNTRIPTYAVLALLTASVAACGVTVAQAAVKVTNLCVPYNGVTIQGVDPGTTEVDHQFTYTKLAALQNLAQEIQNLQFVSLSATAVSGITDLSFIQAANVTVAS